MLKYFIRNDIISLNHSRLKPGDLYTNQHLSITHNIYTSFGEQNMVREVFPHMLKPFIKVWHEVLFSSFSKMACRSKLNI